jgi:uncharacterized membrane protein
MTGRNLKIALAASVLLNVFLLGAGASTALFLNHKAEQRAAAMRRSTPLFVAARGLDPQSQDRLRVQVQAAAKDAWGDFQQAREARAAAAGLAGAPSFDRAAVEARMQAARDAELRGRVKLEKAVLDFMAPLPAEQRARLAPALKGRSFLKSRRAGEHPRGPRREPPAP